MATGSPALSSDLQRLALEMFLSAAGAALVKQVAEILRPHDIPVMPLKGVLLQRLVYDERTFRPISDVDILVPEGRFMDAYGLLHAAGFTQERWEVGGWEVTLKNPAGPPLGVDLHRTLSRTVRSHLTAGGLFQRGTPDHGLFGAPVILPRADDLFAHLLLHATLEWMNVGKVHKPQDFGAVAENLALDSNQCARHLRAQGLTIHALVMLPIIRRTDDAMALRVLADAIRASARERVSAQLASYVCSRFPPTHPVRRIAGLAITPSLGAAVFSAIKDRIERKKPNS